MNRLLSPAVLAAIGAITLWLSLSEVSSDVTYPRLLAAVMLACALLMGVQAVRAAAGPPSSVSWSAGTGRLAAAVVLITGYALSWNLVGFPIATAVFLFALAWLLGERSCLFLALGPILGAGLLWLVLRNLLHVPLPPGPF